MTPIDLARIPYSHRFNGASLLISKANRLADVSAGPADTKRKRLLAAVAYYDLALLLMKPYDPNYATIINWKCNALCQLEQYATAVTWYREIVRLSDETDGQAERNATAKLAEAMITQYSDRKDSPLPPDHGSSTTFDDPPFCRQAEAFGAWLIERKFKHAHASLAPALQQTLPVAELKAAWLALVGAAQADALSVDLERHLLDWPGRKSDEIGWCYLTVSGEGIAEGLSVIVARNPHNGYWITALEFGRP